MQDTEVALWLRLTHTPGLPSRQVRRMLAGLGSLEALAQASTTQLAHWLRTDELTAWVQSSTHGLQLRDATLKWLATSPEGVAHRLIALGDPLYPAPLLHLNDPPLLLHACISEKCLLAGPQHLQTQWCTRSLAVVGSRNATPQGCLNARNLSLSLAEQGWMIVSGMASGIDAAAHAGALDAKGAGTLPTVGVVGTGLDRNYPRQNHALFERVKAGGLLLSEHPLGTPPLAAHFPRRNRLIAALGLGTLVVEAAPQSGSLITARLAADLGREVFAIPGSIHLTASKGCHALIRQGAVLVETVSDILNEFAEAITSPPVARIASGNAQATSAHPHQHLLQTLGADPISVEALCMRMHSSAQDMQTQLLDLELEGRVATLPGGLAQRLTG
jgi:DNA processing protein